MDRDRELHEMADEGRALMSDYIKREDAIRSIADHDEYKGERWIKEAWADYLIEDAKPADVAPVRHGRWEKEYGHYKCLLCNGLDDFADNYCPNCGARMDGDKE